MSSYEYAGSELDLFANATRWKRYLRSQLRPYLRGRVLEVGAGFGGSTAELHGGAVTRWVCLEPDPQLAERLARRIEQGEIPSNCEAVLGMLETYRGSDFDAVLYIDVLEHIREDRQELQRAARRLRPGGHLVVLSPAHPWLYTAFDRAIGHFRRYTRASLRAIAPADLRLVQLRYLDSAGLLASLGNRFLLGASQPSARQIRFWDDILVRLSTGIDPLIRYRLGKSVLAVWEAPGRGSPGVSRNHATCNGSLHAAPCPDPAKNRRKHLQ
jgi:SAM-dependent methyltransferase